MAQKYAKPEVSILGTLAESTKAVKVQPPADGINLTQSGVAPGEDPPINGPVS